MKRLNGLPDLLGRFRRLVGVRALSARTCRRGTPGAAVEVAQFPGLIVDICRQRPGSEALREVSQLAERPTTRRFVIGDMRHKIEARQALDAYPTADGGFAAWW